MSPLQRINVSVVHAGLSPEFRAKKAQEAGLTVSVSGAKVRTHQHQPSSNLESEKGSGMGTVELRKVTEQSSAMCQDADRPGAGR